MKKLLKKIQSIQKKIDALKRQIRDLDINVVYTFNPFLKKSHKDEMKIELKMLLSQKEAFLDSLSIQIEIEKQYTSKQEQSIFKY